VVLRAKKLKAVTQRVVVPLTQPAEVNVVMEVDRPFEEEPVDTRCRIWAMSTPAPVNVDDEFVESIPLWPGGRLVIHEEGQPDILLGASRDQLTGEVRGAKVKVTVKRAEIVGHMAGEPVWIWMHGREAEGNIGGHQVGFWLHQTPTGHLLRGKAVGHTLRLEESHGVLSWLPACERPLLRLPRGPLAETVYQGTCASGRRIRLTLPDALDEMAPLPRLILLALLLTERDETTAAARLFPVKP
jgi:hypothetical protein